VWWWCVLCALSHWWNRGPTALNATVRQRRVHVNYCQYYSSRTRGIIILLEAADAIRRDEFWVSDGKEANSRRRRVLVNKTSEGKNRAEQSSAVQQQQDMNCRLPEKPWTRISMKRGAQEGRGERLSLSAHISRIGRIANSARNTNLWRILLSCDGERVLFIIIIIIIIIDIWGENY